MELSVLEIQLVQSEMSLLPVEMELSFVGTRLVLVEMRLVQMEMFLVTRIVKIIYAGRGPWKYQAVTSSLGITGAIEHIEALRPWWPFRVHRDHRESLNQRIDNLIAAELRQKNMWRNLAFSGANTQTISHAPQEAKATGLEEIEGWW